MAALTAAQFDRAKHTIAVREWRKNRKDPIYQMRKALARAEAARKLTVHEATRGPLHNAFYCLVIALEKQTQAAAGQNPKPLEIKPPTFTSDEDYSI